MGLTLSENKKAKITEDHVLGDLRGKKKDPFKLECLIMGTPEDDIFVDPEDVECLPDVVDDFDLDLSPGSEEWIQHKANENKLQKFTTSTQIHIMNEPRDAKPLLVLDLDHTLLDFSSKRLQQATSYAMGAATAATMKRPYMDEFLTRCYRFYDLVVWSQTSWKWVEVKLTELGMLTNPGYKICFVLDKTSMFSVTSTKRDGTTYKHHVKPLQILWSKFPNRWGPHNTIHLDDLSRNFALNITSGLKVTAFYRKKHKWDSELVRLAMYLQQLAEGGYDFEMVDFGRWSQVENGSKELAETIPTMKKK